MPDFTGSATSIRASGHSLRVFASFYAGTVVYESTISIAPQSGYPYPVVFLGVDSAEPTYDHTDILPGYRVDLYDSAGTSFKGSTRVRFGNTITDTLIPVRETSQANLDIAVDDVVKIINDLRLSDKLTEGNEWFSPDGTPYSDQGSNPPPLARSGGHWAGRVDDGEAFATVQMTGSTSEVVDPDSTLGNVSHLWTLPSGVAFQSGSVDTDADPVLEADVGQHLILHAVTDTDNSKTVTQTVVIMVTDNSTPPHRVIVTGYTGRPEDGFNWNAQVVSGAVDTATIPDGCLCILWARERINNAWQSIRNNSDGREHILAVGYVRRERIRRAANGVNVLEFEFVSPLTRLREITAYSKVMEENASPDSWLEVKTLGVQRAIVQLIQFYTTLVESGFDLLIDDDFLDQRYPAFYLQRNTVHGMLDELAAGQDARVTCDRTGQFLLATHPAFIPLAGRSSTTVAWAITARDVLDVDINVDHYPAVEQYKTSGFSGGASGNEPLFSLYPGSAPGIGTQTPARDRLIVTDQDDLNERTGRYGALADRVLVDSNGKRHPAAEITLTLRGVYNFFDFRNEYVTLTDDYGRRLYSAARFYPTDVTVGFAGNGTASTRVTLLQETHAPAGETYVPPPSSASPIPWSPLPSFPPITQPGFPGDLIGRGVNNIALICGSKLATTTTFQYTSAVGGPVWTATAWGDLSTPITGTVLLWVPDPYTAGSGWVFTTTKIYYLALSTGAATELHSWSTTITSVSADASISEEGFVCAVAYIQGTGTIAAYSTDGATFTEVVLNAAYATDGASFGIHAGCRIPSISAGTVYTSIYTTTGSIGSSTVVSAGRVSTDYGATWSAWTVIAADTDVLAQQIFTPFPTPNVFIYNNLRTLNHNMIRVTNGTPVDISPTISSESFGVVGSRDGISASPQIPTRMLLVGQEDNGGQYAVFLTNDGASSWTNIVAKGTAARHCAIAGNDPNVAWVWGTSNVIAQVAISGNSATLDSRAGNLASLSVGDIIAIAGY